MGPSSVRTIAWNKMPNGIFLDVLIILLAISFFYYGLACIFSRHMVSEFERYGVPKFRILIGILEVLGGVGLLGGYLVPAVQLLSVGGLALLMFCGCVLRLKIRDSVLQILPALTLMILNLWVLFRLLSR
jgi:uncharacterized membrane protein YphA (DoxX/SURF4 family)